MVRKHTITRCVVRWQDGSTDRNENICMLCGRMVCYGHHGQSCELGCETPVYQLEDQYKEVVTSGLNGRD